MYSIHFIGFLFSCTVQTVLLGDKMTKAMYFNLTNYKCELHAYIPPLHEQLRMPSCF